MRDDADVSQAMRSSKSSIAPVAMSTEGAAGRRDRDATFVRRERGSTLDARALTSLVAMGLALGMVLVVAAAGRAMHAHPAGAVGASRVRVGAPLVNYGTPVETPAINLPATRVDIARSEDQRAADSMSASDAAL